MRRQVLDAVSTVAREARRQVGTRGRRRALRAGADHIRTVVRRVPVVARVDPRLRLDRQARHVGDVVSAGLAARGVSSFWLTPSDGARVLCLREDDRDELVRALRATGPAWYVEPLGSDGTATGRIRSVRSWRESWVAASPGFRVWEYVVPHEGSSFVAAEGQGVEIYLWRQDADSGGWSSRVRNLICEQRPGPSFLAEWSGRRATARPSDRVGFPVDVVYTWVDGTDEDWLRQKAVAAAEARSEVLTERAHHESRFADHDELRHSLRSLEQFAPWVNHVWVVTADQHPSWLVEDHPWVSIVRHADIWPDDVGLPTFNSHAIETCLHRIPGLAEHFLYLNDDMLLGRPLPPETFFHPSGIGKFFWSRALVGDGPVSRGEIASTSAARNARRLLAEVLGVTFTRKFFHVAASLTVSGLAELEACFPEVVAATRGRRFRTLDDVALAGSFYLNWAYATGRAVPDELRYTYVDPAAPDADRRLNGLLRHRGFDAFCVNDGSSEEPEHGRRSTDRRIRAFLAEYLPVPGSFEVPD